MSQEGVMGARRKFTAEYKREAVAMLDAPGAGGAIANILPVEPGLGTVTRLEPTHD